LILADSSAWIAFLRGTDTPAAARVRDLVGTGALASTEVVIMEVLAGARAERLADTRRILIQNEIIPMSALEDHEAAADIYRTCRRGGGTVRSLNDCLIAAIAIRSGVPVLHDDRDFEVIARHSPLDTVTT
jgi:predicted nucleic acid-binding protein